MDNLESRKVKKTPLIPSQRMWLALVLFLGEAVVHQHFLGLGIVCMTVDEASNSNSSNNTTNLTELEAYYRDWESGAYSWLFNEGRHFDASSTSGTCDGDVSGSEQEVTSDTGVFHWSRDLQGIMLSAFSYGYTVTMPFGGLIASRFGPHRVLFIGILIRGLIVTLTPGSALLSPYLLIAVEILRGIVTAMWVPCVYHIWPNWIPDGERSKVINFSGAGSMIGSITLSSVHGLLCQYVGWDAVYYIYGPLTVAWCFLWLFTTAETPKKHPRISTAEREYIEQALRNKGLAEKKIKLKDVPWRNVFMSRHIWSVNIAGFLYAAGFGAQSRMSIYLDDVMKLSISENGLYSALPSLTVMVISLLSASLADYLVQRGIKIITVRKIMWSTGLVGAAAIGCGIGFIGCGQVALAATLWSLWLGVTGFIFSGAFLSVMEHAPRYSGIVTGYNNFISNIPMTFMPSVVISMTPNATQEEWRSVFFLSSALLVASALTFVLFGEDGIADWAKESCETDKVEGEIAEYVKDKENDQKKDCSSIIHDNIVTKF